MVFPPVPYLEDIGPDHPPVLQVPLARRRSRTTAWPAGVTSRPPAFLATHRVPVHHAHQRPSRDARELLHGLQELRPDRRPSRDACKPLHGLWAFREAWANPLASPTLPPRRARFATSACLQVLRPDRRLPRDAGLRRKPHRARTPTEYCARPQPRAVSTTNENFYIVLLPDRRQSRDARELPHDQPEPDTTGLLGQHVPVDLSPVPLRERIWRNNRPGGSPTLNKSRYYQYTELNLPHRKSLWHGNVRELLQDLQELRPDCRLSRRHTEYQFFTPKPRPRKLPQEGARRAYCTSRREVPDANRTSPARRGPTAEGTPRASTTVSRRCSRTSAWPAGAKSGPQTVSRRPRTTARPADVWGGA